MWYFGILWNIKYGQAYYNFLNGNILNEYTFKTAKIKYNRNYIGLGKWILRKKNIFTISIYYIYRFPVLSCLVSLNIPFFILFKPDNKYIITLICLIILCLYTQIVLRYTGRLYLGKFADIDESVYAGIPLDIINQYWLNSLAFRRTIFLFIVDILILLFCYSSIYLRLQNIYDGNALLAAEGKLGLNQWIDMVYFTITAFSTTGFGDIHANKQFVLVRYIIGIQIFFSFLHIVGLVFLLSLTTRAEPFQSN